MGREFFKNLQNFCGLDEIWIIARRADRLEEMAQSSKIKTRVVALGLTDRQSISVIEDMLRAENPDIRILINNAGFGKLGYVYELEREAQMNMVELNCASVTGLCAVCLRYMQRNSFIINIASIAAFAPNPRMAVYCSTKAYILSFTKCIREELKPRGINALAVCPGLCPLNFLDVAGISGGKSKTFETLPYCNPASVAKKSLILAQRAGRCILRVSFSSCTVCLPVFLPHGLVMKFSKNIVFLIRLMRFAALSGLYNKEGKIVEKKK